MTTSAPGTPVTIELEPTSRPTPAAERAARLADPGFGRVFTDHMVTARWTAEHGWHDARLRPYGPIQLDPATAALHYGQTVFEGLKAYRWADGSIVTFRPDANARRFARSARRLAMPELPEQLFCDALDALVRQDRHWVPSEPERSLYLRPLMMATEVGLGVNHSAGEFLFALIASPVAAYFSGGVTPVKVWLSEDHVRAAPGGTGEAKCGGNYAAAFAGQDEAIEHGCDQVVWLDAVEHRWVEEMGGMNLFFVHGSGEGARITTPPLSGALLPGITRDSLLTLAPELGYAAAEERISTDGWREGVADGTVTEVFACGTAAVITPVGAVESRSGGWTIGDGEPGPVTMRLRDELLARQYGTTEDRHNWIHRVV
jgi:branched-chain amino acid aminotransferase